MVDLDRKHSKVSKTVKILSVSIWQVKPRGQTIQKKKIQPSTVSNGFHVYYEAKSSQIAVPRASTRCQQSLERVSGWFLEK